ncbi:MAG: M20/M25/M40 family metallo-hydrolase [Bryobacteraceae bacterium]
MKHFSVLVLAPALMAADEAPVRGFQASHLAAQRALEAKARAIPDPVRARQYMHKMAAEPHHAGSPASKAVAEYAAGLLREWGFEVKVEEFEALLPFPTARRVEMTAPVRYRAKLAEPAMKEDPDSRDANQLPLYNAYSASGKVSGELVYVNYGIPADYERLEKMGVDVKGKIVLARYGASWRGTKAKVAQEHGAAACLIYSDPRDDGFFQGDVFPGGAYRPMASGQRGSVMDMPVYVGDPLSPGWASEKGGRKLKMEEAVTLMRIPVLPLSADDALPLLRELRGAVAPVEWRGALPVTYHVGPGPAAVTVEAAFDFSSRPVYDVIGTLTGRELPDEWVIYGNHHDAWVNGAGDPVSGAIALLEAARAVGELAKSGWRPRRTLKFALWDAEEFGLIGSTEWVEKHRAELQAKAVAYLNSDMNTAGTLGAGGSHTLETFFREVARDTADPKSGKALTEAAGGEEKAEEFRLGAPGAGSDYVAFVHHAGIPVVNAGFRKAGAQGTYHSIYDSVAWFEKAMDGDYLYSKALAQVMTTAVLRLSESDVYPLAFGAVDRVVGEAAKGLASKGVAVTAVNEALGKLRAASAKYESAYAAAMASGGGVPGDVNGLLRTAERMLCDDDGLRGRTWYKHRLYAPGLYTGYSAFVLPGVAEAQMAGRMDEANAEAAPAAAAIVRLAELVDRAAAALAK